MFQARKGLDAPRRGNSAGPIAAALSFSSRDHGQRVDDKHFRDMLYLI
jgi:hypothetical protein